MNRTIRLSRQLVYPAKGHVRAADLLFLQGR